MKANNTIEISSKSQHGIILHVIFVFVALPTIMTIYEFLKTYFFGNLMINRVT